MELVSDIEDRLPLRDEFGCLAIVDCGGSQQVQRGMVMLVVVPGEEVLAETARILDRAKSIRIVRPVLHGFEVRFRERVVVADMGAAVSLDHA